MNYLYVKEKSVSYFLQHKSKTEGSCQILLLHAHRKIPSGFIEGYSRKAHLPEELLSMGRKQVRLGADPPGRYSSVTLKGMESSLCLCRVE